VLDGRPPRHTWDIKASKDPETSSIFCQQDMVLCKLKAVLPSPDFFVWKKPGGFKTSLWRVLEYLLARISGEFWTKLVAKIEKSQQQLKASQRSSYPELGS
jgi:hypothetical protein